MRDLIACLNIQRSKLHHSEIRDTVSRSNLVDAAERGDYRLFEALGQRLIVITLAPYGDEDLGLRLKGPVFARGLDDYRSVPVAVPVYAFPADQGRREGPCSDRLARRHPRVHQHQQVGHAADALSIFECPYHAVPCHLRVGQVAQLASGLKPVTPVIRMEVGASIS